MLCVENHATFRTLTRTLRERGAPPWVAVAWVQGRNTAPLESLINLPFTVTGLDYLGDLDPAGLAIAAAACAATERVGITAAPAAHLWRLLIERPTRKGREASENEARRLVAWLPDDLRPRAYELLVMGRAIPQEALSFEVLAATVT
jgi:hypothetical protein